MESRRSNFWKITLFRLLATDFLASWNHLFLPFWYTPATANFIFSSSENVFLNVFRFVESDFLASGNTFFIYISYIFFSSSENIVLKKIPHSGLSKRMFWLVETILFQYLKYYFHWNQFFHLLQLYFRRILYYSQIFCLLETIFFHSDFFGNQYCN